MIDYYSAPDEPDGSPAFSLDVRPAVDSVGSLKQRIAAATQALADSLDQIAPALGLAATKTTP